jgi:hypothetical protein
MISHTTRPNTIASTARLRRNAAAEPTATASTMPNTIDIIMCTTSPITSAPTLNVAPNRAERHTVWAMRLSGDQNPLPVNASTIMDHIAMTTPPIMPPTAPRLSTSVFISDSRL